jgi:thiamine biosynthesis lipoprotein
VTRALLEAGGDITVGDAPPGRPGWQIDAGRADATFRVRASRLTNASLATSGPTAQFVEIDGVRYSHVIDPRTGFGLTNQVLARVIAQDATTADALSTALTVVGVHDAPRLLDRFPDVLVSLVTDEKGSALGQLELGVCRALRAPGLGYHRPNPGTPQNAAFAGNLEAGFIAVSFRH